MQNVYSTSWWDMTPLQVRDRINERIMDIEAPVPPVWAIENRIIENGTRATPVRVYLPNQKENLPVILLIHGGAWVAGNLDTHDNLARYLCSQVEAIVVSVGYMNAPEGKFPLQVHQSLDVLTWIINHGNEFSANPSKLVPQLKNFHAQVWRFFRKPFEKLPCRGSDSTNVAQVLRA